MELDNLNIKVGPQICYEGLFPQFSTGLARRGAEVIVNVTNDSWYGYPFEPRQHLYMTFARAVETRLPLVRSTNSGSSGAITAQGKVLLASPTDTHWWGAVEVPLTSKPQLSFYSKFGHREVLIWVVLLIAILVHSQWKRVTKPSRKDINTI
ncbi:MAG TPA: nitrilase-related carbon-nitrogen hydrolase [Pseudobdellovibrionaceae bacterium]|nr:nitrilase-related carbon-nitrogen hydrolase [Pseudobdellovibrionaceae bacterium]